MRTLFFYCLVFINIGILAPHKQVFARGIVINTPDDVQEARFTLRSPDDGVPILGKVSFRLDLASEHDSLLELSIRRAGLILENEQPITRFGYSLAAGIIVGGTGPIDHISVAGVEPNGTGRQVLTLFHNASNEIIAPQAQDIALFDMDFKRLPLSYRPRIKPNALSVPVSLLIDQSGSMSTVMPDVIRAADTFLANLPR